MRRRTTLIPVAVTAFALVGTALAPAAQAAVEEEVVTGLVTPLSVTVGPDGTVFVAQNFASMLTMKAPGEDAEVIYADEAGREVGALSLVGDVLTFATTNMDHSPGALLYTYEPTDAGWVQTEVADLAGHEAETNPDGGQRYGIVKLARSCKKKFKKGTKWMLPYKGIVESHPYATTTVGETTYVADAAANAILAVSGGEVSTKAVLPPTKIKITKKVRKTLGLPRCAKGHSLKVEPVPTDVEVGPDGNLYVTTLPGGPEDPSLGANGSIYQVNGVSGAVSLMGSGFVSPTGLAISPTGDAYVSMLFAGMVMKVPLGGAPEPFAEVALPGDVEFRDGFVYVTEVDLFNDGSSPPAGRVVRFPAS